ncbi:MAG: PAS domain S-box protein, partial [Actinomycetota bacterium]
MQLLIDVIGWVDAAVFALLTILSTRQWLRTRAKASGWLAAAFGAFASVILVGELLPEDASGGAEWAGRLLICVLVLFPYLLFRFGAALEPASRRLELVAALLTAAVVIATLALPDFPDEASDSAYLQAYIWLVLGQWTALSSLVAARLWRAGVRQPGVVRRRVRLLSLASIGMSMALILAGVLSSADSLGLDLIVQLLAVSSALMFFGGSFPPTWLRTLWRMEEEDQVRQASVKLMVATSREEILDSILPHVAGVVGGRAAAILDREGNVLASHRVGRELEGQLAGKLEEQDGLIRVELAFGSLVVWATPYTPLFGRDEIQLLNSVGALAALALERTQLFALERQARRSLERANVELASATAELEQEVAERRRAEEDLIESQMQLAEAQEITLLGSWGWDIENDRLVWSDQMYRIYGVDQSRFEATFDSFMEIVHPDDREVVRGAVDLMSLGEDSFSLDHRIVRPDGRARVVHARGKAIRDVTGRPVRLIGTSQDITKRKQAEERLRASEMRFRNLAHSATEAIVSADSKGTIVFWNRGAQEIFGYFEDEVLGRPLQTLMPEAYRERHAQGLRRYLETDESSIIGSSVELEALRKDGAVFPVELSISTWEADGERFFTGILRDISVRKAAEDEVERFARQNQSILDSAGEGIFGLGLDGRMKFINPAGAVMLGYAVEELIGKSSHRTCHHTKPDGTPYPLEECPIYETLRSGRPTRVDNEAFWRKDGSSFPVEYVATPIVEHGELTGTVVVYRDLSERREYERMKELERLKDEFVSVVSHELRTPLTSIRGALGLLASGLLGEVPDRGQRMLDIAVANTDRLVRLINDILDIERIESGEIPMHLEEVESAEVLQDVADAMAATAMEAAVDLVVNAQSARVLADSDHLVQALTNLVANAIKFSPESGRVWLSVRTEGTDALFEVRDEGRGIPEDMLDLIFERFAQVDTSDSRQKGGTGLGLAISRSIVERHGGRIWVESEVGRGSTFSFSMPLLKHTRPPTAPERQDAAGALPPVLVCDDDDSVREVVGELLRVHGYGVIAASSGEEAIDLAREHRPSAVLMDLMLPGMSGWETAASLRRDPLTQGVPIIITSVLAPGEGSDPVGGDVDAWITKPLDEAALLAALQRSLEDQQRPARVLIVEDDLDLARVIAATFERHGLHTWHAST